ADGVKEKHWKNDDGREIRQIGDKYEIKGPDGSWTEIDAKGRMSRVLQGLGEHELRVTQHTKPVKPGEADPQNNEVVTAKTTDGKTIQRYRDNDGNLIETSDKGTVVTTKSGAVFVINGDKVMVRGHDGQFHAVSESDLPEGATKLANGGVQVGGMKIQSEAEGGIVGPDGRRVRTHCHGHDRTLTIEDQNNPERKVETTVNSETGASTVKYPD